MMRKGRKFGQQHAEEKNLSPRHCKCHSFVCQVRNSGLTYPSIISRRADLWPGSRAATLLLGLVEGKWSVVVVIFCLSTWGVWALEPMHEVNLRGCQVLELPRGGKGRFVGPGACVCAVAGLCLRLEGLLGRLAREKGSCLMLSLSQYHVKVVKTCRLYSPFD